MDQGPSISFNRGTEGVSLLGPVLSAGIGDEISTAEAPMDLTSKQQAQLRGLLGKHRAMGSPRKGLGVSLGSFLQEARNCVMLKNKA